MRNSINASVFSLFYPFFNRKMAAILNFEIFFQFFFQKAQLDPGRVIVWKFEGRRSSGLVATRGTYTHTHIHTYTDTHKVNNRTNLFQQSWFLHWSLNYCWRFPTRKNKHNAMLQWKPFKWLDFSKLWLFQFSTWLWTGFFS